MALLLKKFVLLTLCSTPTCYLAAASAKALTFDMTLFYIYFWFEIKSLAEKKRQRKQNKRKGN